MTSTVPARRHVALAGAGVGTATAICGFTIAALAARAPAPAALLVLAVVTIAAALARPQLTAVVAIGLLWADVPVVAVRDHGVPFVAAAALPLLLCATIARELLRGRRVVLERGALWLGALVLAATLSTMLSEHQDVAAASLATLITEGAVLYLLVSNAVRSEPAVRGALWAIVAAGSWLAMLAVAQNVSGRYDRPLGGFAEIDLAYARGLADVPRAFGPVGDPNYFAQILVAVLAVALVAARFESTALRRMLAGGALLLTLGAIGYTGSRGAVVAMVLMLVVAVWIGALRLRHAGVAALLGVALVLTIPGYRDRVQSLVQPGSVTASAGEAEAADQSARSRATETLAALLAWSEHPLLGAGPGAFPLLYQQYAPRIGYEVHDKGVGAQEGQAPTREAHNLYLGIAADMGVAGLLAFLGLVGAVLRPLLVGARRLRRVEPGLAACAAALGLALVGYLGAGVFLSLAYQPYFWSLLGIAAATAGLIRPHLRDAGQRAAPSPVRRALAARTTRDRRAAG